MNVNDAMKRSADCLLRQATGDGGWSDTEGHRPSSLNTAEVLLALMAVDGDVVTAGDVRVQAGARFLEYCQNDIEGSERDCGAWRRAGPDENPQGRGADIIRTSFALQALVRVGRGVGHPHLGKGLDWLMKLQRDEDGGWPFPYQETPSLMATSFALLALLTAHRAGCECEEAIERGLESLVGYADPSGRFGEDGSLAGPYTIHALLALQAARLQGVGKNYLNQENAALDWLLAHPDRAKRLVEESIPYMRADGVPGTFGYLHMTDAQLVQVLCNASDKTYRESILADEAMHSLKDKMQDDGGFFGYRTFSWSTAKAVVGLGAAQHEYVQFPEREPELTDGGRLQRRDVIGFTLLAALIVAVVLISLFGDFGAVQAGVLIVLMLGVLVTGRVISEDAFTSLVTKVTQTLPWGSKESGSDNEA